MYCQSAFHPRSHKDQHDANVLCFGTSVSIKLQPSQNATKRLVSTKSTKILNTLQCLFLFNLFVWKCWIFTMLVVLKGSWQKPLRYGIHNHLCYKMSFFHVPLHVPCEMSRIVDLHFKVRPCWLGHVGNNKKHQQVFPQKSLQPFKPQHMQHLFPTSSATWTTGPKMISSCHWICLATCFLRL